MALTHSVSPLRCYRLAHGRTVTDVVNACNDLDPAGTATLRESRLFDFEAWPGSGRRPPSRVLAVLAQIYQTSARNLVSEEVFAGYSVYHRDVIDQADFRHLDVFQGDTSRSVPRQRVSMDEGNPVRPRRQVAEEAQAAALSAESCKELLRAVSAEEADMKRRELLFELSLALGGAPALTLLRHLEPGEEERLARVVQAQGRVDTQTVTTIEKLTAQCRRLDDTYGPAKVLPVVEAQRDMVTRLLQSQTLLPGLRRRLIHTYAELAQLAGFLHFDRMDFTAATLSFDRGLEAARDSGDAVLTAYIHHWCCEVAILAGHPSKGLDHAFAAQGWARRGASNLIRARVDMVEAWAHSLMGSATDALRKLEAARSWAGRPTHSEPSYLYWIKESEAMDGSACFIYNALGRAADALDSADAQLATLRSDFTRERAFGLIHQGIAHAQTKDVPAATAKLSEAVTLMHRHSSARLGDLLTQARKRLDPWSGNAYVRGLDEKMRTVAMT